MNVKGENITKAFIFIQKFYSEVAQLFTKVDDLMEKERWDSAKGNTTTSEVSKDLLKPTQWLPSRSFRLYKNEKFPNVRIGLIVCYGHENIEEPLLIIGKIDYKDIQDAEYWDMWNLWFNDKQQKTLNEDNFSFDPDDEDLSKKLGGKCWIHAMNLVEINSEEDIKNKIFDKIINQGFADLITE